MERRRGQVRNQERVQDPPLQYEHFIQKEDELNRIREYIRNNPLKWSLDRENPDRTGKDILYMTS